MATRWILFGYKVVNDQYVIVPEEAKTVKRIFNSYVEGSALKTIADDLTKEKVPYSKERNSWNKNIILRILENTHYQGDERYPQIISETIFTKAMSRKTALGGKREKDTPEVSFLKSVLYCSSCEGRIRRTGKDKGRREKWSCENKCKTKVFFDDETMFGSVLVTLNRVIDNPDLLDCEIETVSYTPDIDTTRRINEVRYMMDQHQIEFQPIKKVLFNCVEAKFNGFPFVARVYTESLKQYMSQQHKQSELNIELLSTTVERINMNIDGSLTLKFINSKEVNSNEGTVS